MTSCTNEQQAIQKVRDARRWVQSTTGDFGAFIFGKETGFNDVNVRNDLLFEFVESGLIEPTGKSNGFYRKVDKNLIKLDWRKVRDNGDSEKLYPLIMPLGLNQLCGISNQNVIVIAGESNSGKSELALEIAHNNLKAHGGAHAEIDYYSNEFSEGELCGRIGNINNKSNWDGLEVYQRYDDFHSVVRPGYLSIIDYLEVHDNFWLMGEKLDKIHRAIGNGVAVVCIQKHQNSEFGMGGQFGSHRTRLMLSIAYNKETHFRTAKILKCKKPLSATHPDGMQMDYRVNHGRVEIVHQWAHISKEQRESRDKIAASELRQAELKNNNAQARDAMGF